MAALLLRVIIFVLYLVSFGPYFSSFDGAWVALCNFNVEMMLAMIILTGFEIVFNFIDLIRHGIRGVAAGPYMPIALPLTSFAVLSGIFYFTSQLPVGAAPSGTMAVMFNVMLIVGPLFDFFLIDEKGTVPFFSVLMWQIYPILFHIFGYLRTVIWPSTAIYNDYMYSLPFLNYFGANIVGYSVMFFALTLGLGSLLVLIGNLLSGKYRTYNFRRD
ncbi:MAG: hypothetical protein IJ787_03860 [Bacilli bacterium]|nr:hypothetical protein [Bacilli bacterium]MDY6391512.1 hypothetical protein [Bacilli bacterium]